MARMGWRCVGFALWLGAACLLPGCATQPGAVAQSAATAEAQINALEQRRLAALKDRDGATLEAVLADDYMHVHGTGKVEDRPTFIKGMLARPRQSERGPLKTRIYGDVAVIIGEQTNLTKNADGSPAPPQHYMATQIVRRAKDGWRYVSMQVTPLKAAATTSSTITGYPAAPPEQLTGDQRQVLALEARRVSALANADLAALANVLADDYVHIYGDGRASDRAGYIEQVRMASRAPTRGPLKVRVYGDVAVVTGDLLNRINYPEGPRALDTFVTQVAHKAGGQWRFVSFQITPKTGQ